MTTTDESENLSDHLSERIDLNGWRVLSNPTYQPDPQPVELKTLIQTIHARQRRPGTRKQEETDPPEVA
jgi:hypothetical protein